MSVHLESLAMLPHVISQGDAGGDRAPVKTVTLTCCGICGSAVITTSTSLPGSAAVVPSTPDSSSFGANALVLANADTNQGVVGIFDSCDPVSDCFGTASGFNIRAEVFGEAHYS